MLHRFQSDRRSGRTRALHHHDVQDGEERQSGFEKRGRPRADPRLQRHHSHAAGGGARRLRGVGRRQLGTKWNAQHLQLHVGDGFVRFQFDTPWNFPLPVFEALAEEFPNLVFSGSAYEDNGALAFRGQFNGNGSWRPVKVERGDEDDDRD